MKMTRKKQSEGKKKNEEIKPDNKELKDKNVINPAGKPEEAESETAGEKTQDQESVVIEEKEESTDRSVSLENELMAKLADLQDRYLRLSAEFDNYRKRTLREKIELTKQAGENILLGIIPVMDDFERALKMMGDSGECPAIKEGIDLIYNKFGDFLRQNGIKEIDSLNREFNVDLHEAVTKIQVEDEAMKGKIVEVIQKGYFLNDKVIRYAKVIVGE